MKNNKTLFLLMFAFALIIFPSTSFADDSLSDALDSIFYAGVNFDGTSKDVEYFHLWLRYIFGSFIFEPWTGETGDITALTYALGFTNLLALFFGLIMMGYIFGGGALNSAHSGEVLGQDWSTIWMPIRTLLGVGVIMPAPGIGAGVLSFAQVGIIWLVIFGSNAGTFIWHNSVDKMVLYGTYGAIPQTSTSKSMYDLTKIMLCVDQKVKTDRKDGVLQVSNENTLTKARIATIQYQSKSNTDKTVQHVYSRGSVENYFYPVMSDAIWENVTKSKGSTYTHTLSGIKSLIKKVKSSSNYITDIQFEGCGSISDLGALNDAVLTANKSSSGNTAATLATKTDPALNDIRKKYQKDTLVNALKSAFSIAQDIGSLSSGNSVKALALISTNNEDPDKESMVNKLGSIAKIFSKASKDYQTDVSFTLPKEHYGKLKNVEHSIDDFKYGGWAGAGMWFLKIGQSESAITNAKYDGTVVSKTPSFCNLIDPQTKRVNSGCQESYDTFKAGSELIDEIYKSPSGNSIIKSTDSSNPDGNSNFSNSTSDMTQKCLSEDDCSLSVTDVKGYASGAAHFVLSAMASNHTMDSDGNQSDVSGGFLSMNGLQNPFLTLSTIGHTMNKVALSVVAIAFALKVASGFSKNFFATVVVGESASEALQFAAMLLMPLIITLLSSGFVLAYLIPFLPVLAWINMMVGYLITVIEAVTAAPLAAIQLLTPEGKGIVGTRLERAMQLLIVVILKPTLMIIGMLAAISISSVAFSIFNSFFWQAVSIGIGSGPIDFVAVLLIYTSSALALAKLVVSIMHTLPVHILEWFAAGTGGRSFGEGNVEGGLENSAKELKSTSESFIARGMQGGKKPGGKPGGKPEDPKPVRGAFKAGGRGRR